jgi:hypothetical protein
MRTLEMEGAAMRRLLPVTLVALVFATLGCGQGPSSIGPTSPSGVSLGAGVSADARLAQRNERACWGEASEALARLGEMGIHASQQSTPRLGLRNVARALYEAGVLPDDTLQALGAFLSSALGLSIDSCL